MRKKAQATGMVWALAFIVIFILCAIFIAAVIFFNIFSFGKGNSQIAFSSGTSTNPVLQKNFLSFLNKKVILEDITILELIEDKEMNQEEKQNMFSLDAELFFDEIFPFPAEESGWHGVHPYWIRVYDRGEEIGKSTNYIEAGSYNCRAFDESSITLVYYTENKKISLCVLKDYYETIQNAKKIE